MDGIDRDIINSLQGGFPLTERPFADEAARFGLTEAQLIERIGSMLETGLLTRFGPLFNVERMGGAVVLAAMAVPEARFEEVAAQVNAHPEVAHNYERDHDYNMWFVVAATEPQRIKSVIAEIEAETGLPVLELPKEEEYFLEFRIAI